jgi:hypothetical protein
MRTVKHIGPAVLIMAALACGPTAPESSSPGSTAPDMQSAERAEKVTGAGQFVHPVFGTVTFAFVAKRHGNGRVSGSFYQNQHDLGFVYAGEVTCLAVDQVNHRAWIGGVLTYSNDPDPVTQVGDDAWFRVLDTGKNSTEPDRSTFMGFEQPVPPFDTSEHYCEAMPWPEANARTWPVVRGKIVIH